MEKEYVATFKSSRQISPDDWDVFNPSLKVTDETTIREIHEWYEKNMGDMNMEVKLILLKNTKKQNHE